MKDANANPVIAMAKYIGSWDPKIEFKTNMPINPKIIAVTNPMVKNLITLGLYIFGLWYYIIFAF